MEIVRSSSDLLFVVGSGREVAGPVGIGVVRVWEHVIIFRGPGHVVALYGINVCAWGRVEQVESVAVVLVHVVNHGIHVHIVGESILVLEVTAEEDENFISRIMLSSLIKTVSEPSSFCLSIKVLRMSVVDPVISTLLKIPAELLRRAVMAVENVSKNLGVGTKTLSVWSPDELHLAVGHSLILVSIIKTGKEPSIVAHLGEETSIGVRVTEWIDLPSDSRLDSELIEDPLMSDDVIVDHVLVSWASLIVHGPSSVDKLELTVGNELLDESLHVIILVFPPHLEEFHLNFGELSFGVVPEAVHNGCEFDTYVGILSLLFAAIVVLINGLEPSNVIMRMWHNVHINWLSRFVMFDIGIELVMVVLTMIFGDCSICDAQKSSQCN